MDVRVKHKKTLKEKMLPIKVYQAMKGKYTLLEELPGQQAPEPETKKNDPPAELAETNSFIKESARNDADSIKGPLANKQLSAIDESQESHNERKDNYGESILDPKDIYFNITGKKPDGRWSPEKLESKINELKQSKTEE